MKTIILVSVACINVNVYSQEIEDIGRKEVNMYEFGIPVTSCDCNFENLLFNWRYWITNHKETKLLSYEYVEQLINADKIAYYAKLMSNWESTMFNISRRNGREKQSNFFRGNIIREIKVVPTTYNEVLQSIPKEILADSAKMKASKKELDKEMEMRRVIFEKEMQEGDEIFLLKFETKKKIYDYYVVCRPGKNKIVPVVELLAQIKILWSEFRMQ
ncbi:MAG: hypothetical protein LBD59_01800 [Prevotellaceae bacterium]|jgi:hypothetical protein|nr:hypothetical protein [Prevotellaceae bacterium]